MHGITAVTAFVDWNSQIHVLRLKEYMQEDWFLERIFERLFRRIATALKKNVAGDRFKVELRLYYGWHKGFEEQPSRRAVRVFLQSPEYAMLTQLLASVVFSSVSFGDKLLTSDTKRLHPRLDIHLPNTLRNGRFAGQPPYEKMVDTALAADLLTWACGHEEGGVRVCDAKIALVIAEDDDCWPPVLAGEPMWRRWGGRALVLQQDLPAGGMPFTDGLIAKES